MNRQFDETMRSTGQFARHFVTLTSDVSKFGQNLDSGRMKLGEYYRTWQGHTKKTSSLVKELAKQQVMLENAIVQPIGKNAQGLMQYNVMVQSGLDATKNKSALLRQELSIMNKVMNDGANQLINWGKNTQWAGRQLTVGLTVPLAAFGMAAAKAFRQADEELVRLTKVYGGLTQTSTADLLKVRKDVAALSRELASGLGANFTETIALAADIAATGKEGTALLDSTRQTTRLAILGEVDRQEAMKATLSIQTAFGKNTEELAQSIDFLNAVENQTSTSLADLVEAIPKAGPVVKALGGDVEDLALYLTAMREGGINASEGANALKSALASIINPTKVAKEQFMGLGIDLEGIVNKNAGNLTGTVMALKDSLDALKPLDRARAIEQLFGKFQFARINALFENLGKQGSQTLQVLDLMKASTQDLASISERELKSMTESASGKYKRALESVKADLAVIGEQFLKVGTFVLNAIDGIVKFIGNLPGPIKAVLGFIGSLTAIAGPIIMLTGVLANFFGYIVKGIFALKSIGKGGTGFKLLTPELIAAQSAAKNVEEAFYSDTKAAATFSDAVLTLAASFEKLRQNAMSSTIATSNSMSTLAGNTVMAGGGRIVDKNNPLVGKAYSRDMSHMIPTGSKTPQQRADETIFSTVPGPKPVNQRISNAAQVYMNDDLPRINGLTAANGVSTGVVAAEAAKWHSMTAAIAMQSKAEIATLKTEVAATGTITASLAESYHALLPQMTKITALAADETALIVNQLQAGKITVEAARAKIFALNTQVEAMMAQTAQGVATAQARSLNLTTVPLTSQPVVSPTGKSNMKELFHKSETSKLVDSIARGLGVRTSGAGYSIQTTKPRFNNGGLVEGFGPNKTQVSGPASIGYDDRMGSVPIGGYVLNQAASLDPRNAPLVAAAASTHETNGNNITALLTPKETVFGAGIQDNPELFKAVEAANNGVPLPRHAAGGRVRFSRHGYGLKRPKLNNQSKLQRTHITDDLSGLMLLLPQELNLGVNANGDGLTGSRIAGLIKETIASGTNPNSLMNEAAVTLGGSSLQAEKRNRAALKKLIETLESPDNVNRMIGGKRDPFGFERLAKQIYVPALRGIRINSARAGGTHNLYSAISQIYTTRAQQVLTRDEAIARGLISGDPNGSTTRGQIVQRRSGRLSWASNNTNTGTKMPSWAKGTRLGTLLTTANGISHALKLIKRNKGGEIGGPITSGKMNYGIPKLSQATIDKLTAKWAPPRQFYQPGFQYKLGNQDPLHGPLQIGLSQNLKQYASSATRDPYFRESIVYKDDRFNRINIMDAFLTGTMEKRGKYATAQYMEGNLDIMSQMERLGNHPLGPIAAMRSVQKKYTGKLFRGLKLDKTFKGLPQDLIDAIKLARATGDASGLIGKEFIMRRSSWSKSPDIASFFAPGSNVSPDSLVIEAAVKNRNILPAGDMFPDKKFMAPYGQDWSAGQLGKQYRSEREAIFGGKFRVVGFDKGRLKVETVVDGAREMGGPVNAGRPYLVGENGPEVFVPKNSGGIIPNYAVGGLIRRGKDSYGVSGNPAVRAKQAADKAARAAAYETAPVAAPVYKDGPLSGVRTTTIGNGGVRTNSYGLQGSFPYAPGLTIGHQTINKMKAAMISASKQIEMSLYALGTSIKKDAVNVAKTLRYSGDQLVVGTRLIGGQIKSALDSIALGAKNFGAGVMSTAKSVGNSLKEKGSAIVNSYKPGGATILQYGVPGANASGVGSSYARPGEIATGTKMKTAFATNAKYSATAMAHPLQYLNTKGVNLGANMGSGMVGNTVGMMGGMAAGTAIGGKLGGQGGAMMGSMVGMMAGPQLMAAGGKAIAARAAASAAAGGLASAGFGATAAAAAGLIAPLAAVTAAGYAGYKMWKHYKEGQELNIATFGLNAEAAKKANLRFTDFGAKIKDTIQDARDLDSANRLVYESMKDGGTPFKMTIAEYKKLKVEVKETFGEQIKALNRQPSTKVPDAVKRLKEQLIGAGMSAEEATKKIYTMLRLSNKKDQAITATMGNAKFKAITDPQTAAISAVSSFGQATRNEGSEEKAIALNNALMATETGINDLIAKRERLVAKDITGKIKSLTYVEAEKIMVDRLNNSKEATTKITQDTVDEIAKTNPQVTKMINESDTVVSVWQKIRLEAQGFRGDLSALSSEQAGVIANAFAAVGDAVAKSNQKGLLKDQYKALGDLDTKIKAYTKSLKGQTVSQQISDRDRLKALNKQIEANNKLAEARKKALAAAQDDANLGRQIEKTRLEMQNAQSTGDTVKAQELRIDLESLTSQQQTEAQMRAIDTATEAANKPLQAAVEAISNKQQKIADSAALAGESLDKLRDKYAEQKAAIDKFNSAVTALQVNAALAGKTLAEYVKTKDGREEAAGVVSSYEGATGKKMPRYVGGKDGSKPTPVSPGQNAIDLVGKGDINTKANDALAKAIGGGSTLADIVKALGGYVPTKKNGNTTYGGEVKTAKASKEIKDVYDAYKDVLSQGQSKKVQTATGANFEVFKWKGKAYAKDVMTSLIYSYNEETLEVGKKAIKGAATGVMGGKGTFLVGEKGPEIIHLKSPANIMPNDIMNTIAAASPKYSFNRNAYNVRGEGAVGASYVVNQNIYASEGMDLEALSNMIVKKAEVVIGQKAKINVKMVGQGKNI
jgi:TP901 family phage tail tape measure protein